MFLAPRPPPGAGAILLSELDDLGPHRYCVPCNVRWRGDGACLSCDGPGELREITDPPGWPKLSFPPALIPGRAA
jgi:hypothetical protein